LSIKDAVLSVGQYFTQVLGVSLNSFHLNRFIHHQINDIETHSIAHQINHSTVFVALCFKSSLLQISSQVFHNQDMVHTHIAFSAVVPTRVFQITQSHLETNLDANQNIPQVIGFTIVQNNSQSHLETLSQVVCGVQGSCVGAQNNSCNSLSYPNVNQLLAQALNCSVKYGDLSSSHKIFSLLLS
jgi:hypothetical protein